MNDFKGCRRFSVPSVAWQGSDPSASCSLTCDGALALILDVGGTVSLWNTLLPAKVGVLRGNSERVLACHVSYDGRLAATASSDGHLCLWQVSSAFPLRCIQSMRCVQVPISATCLAAGCSFSHDGTKIIASFVLGDDSIVCTASVDEERVLSGWAVNGVALSQITVSMHYVAACASSHADTRYSSFSAFVMNYQTGEYVVEWVTKGPPQVSMSSNASLLVFADEERLAVCEVSMQGQVTFLEGYQPAMDTRRACCIDGDGRIVAATCGGNSIGVWDLQSTSLVALLDGRAHVPITLAMSSDGHHLLCCYVDQRSCLWTLECVAHQMQKVATSAVSSSALSSQSLCPEQNQTCATNSGTSHIFTNIFTAGNTRIHQASEKPLCLYRDSPAMSTVITRKDGAVSQQFSPVVAPSEHYWLGCTGRAVFRRAVKVDEKFMTHCQAFIAIKALLLSSARSSIIDDGVIEDSLEAADVGEKERLDEDEFISALSSVAGHFQLDAAGWIVLYAKTLFRFGQGKNTCTLTYSNAVELMVTLISEAGLPSALLSMDLEALFERVDEEETERIEEHQFVKVFQMILETFEFPPDHRSTRSLWEGIFNNASGSLTSGISVRQASRIIANTVSRGSDDGRLPAADTQIRRGFVQDLFLRTGFVASGYVNIDVFVDVAERVVSCCYRRHTT